MLEAFSVEKDNNLQSATEVVLTFEERQKSRHKTKTVCGQILGWFLERGIVLQDGEFLKCTDGRLIKVKAASESVSEVESCDQFQLTRIAYHLGNRHVPLQIELGLLRYQHDHVLDDMVRGLGLKVTHNQAPFNPENGAYHGQAGHAHSHTHSHSHTH